MTGLLGLILKGDGGEPSRGAISIHDRSSPNLGLAPLEASDEIGPLSDVERRLVIDFRRFAMLERLGGGYPPAKRRPGRPRGADIDRERAMRAWITVHIVRMEASRRFVFDWFGPVRKSNRAVIKDAREFEELPVNRKHEPLFRKASDAALESSLSRGKIKLRIGPDWRSEVCEKLIGLNEND